MNGRKEDTALLRPRVSARLHRAEAMRHFYQFYIIRAPCHGAQLPHQNFTGHHFLGAIYLLWRRNRYSSSCLRETFAAPGRWLKAAATWWRCLTKLNGINGGRAHQDRMGRVEREQRILAYARHIAKEMKRNVLLGKRSPHALVSWVMVIQFASQECRVPSAVFTRAGNDSFATGATRCRKQKSPPRWSASNGK